jgi:hypothetical protein
MEIKDLKVLFDNGALKTATVCRLTKKYHTFISSVSEAALDKQQTFRALCS